MKKIFLTLSSSFIILPLFSQTYCGSARYDTEVFSNVTTTSNVVYGSNKNWANSTTTLDMDIYEPASDTAVKRPLIIFAHGGSFITGTKTDPDQVTLSTRFAKRGYVTASINYRLGFFPVNNQNAQEAVFRAVQDMKAAVRFFRKDAYTTNAYKIDTNYIFIGGFSAGGFIAVHYAYLDQWSEVPVEIDTTDPGLGGGMEGNSGNPGYSSKVNAIINLAGAVGDTTWIQPGDEPMMTGQGDTDNTVPYCCDTICVPACNLGGTPLLEVCGGGIMTIRAQNIGLANPIHTYYGQDHGAPISSSNMDTTIFLASDFVYTQLGCTPSNTVPYTNAPTCVSGLGTEEIILNPKQVKVFPNPASENILLILKGVKGKNFSGQICDLTGRVLQQPEISNFSCKISRNDLPAGMYFLKLSSDEHETFVAKIIFTD